MGREDGDGAEDIHIPTFFIGQDGIKLLCFFKWLNIMPIFIQTLISL